MKCEGCGADLSQSVKDLPLVIEKLMPFSYEQIMNFEGMVVRCGNCDFPNKIRRSGAMVLPEHEREENLANDVYANCKNCRDRMRAEELVKAPPKELNALDVLTSIADAFDLFGFSQSVSIKRGFKVKGDLFRIKYIKSEKGVPVEAWCQYRRKDLRHKTLKDIASDLKPPEKGQ